MRRIYILLAAFLLAALLVSCSTATPESSGKSDKVETSEVEEVSYEAGPKKQSVTDYELTLSVAGQDYTGRFTGTLNEGKPEGEGKFTSGKLIYTGTFKDLAVDTGKIGGYPMSVLIKDTDYAGTYQGDVTSGQMAGNGSFTGDSLVYEGTFEGGAPTGTGTFTSLPCEALIAGQALAGSYTGPASAFVPEGEGSFTSDKISYTGTFAAGSAADGTVSELPLAVKVQETDITGTYTGVIAAGAVTGEGVLAADPFRYTGSFEAGALKDGVIENFPLKVTVHGAEISGTYTGVLAGGAITGEGSLAADPVKYTGSFEAGIPKDGTMENLPLKVTVQGTEISGTYTGPIASGEATGSATFTSDALTYTGTFTSGAMTGDGTFSSIAAAITFQDRTFTGTYAGLATAFLPNGEGTFEAPADADGYYLSFSGTFSQGALGTGTLKTNHCSITFRSSDSDEPYSRLGTYEGPLADGALTGTDCHFSAVNGYYISYDQTGSMVNGSFDGPAVATYHMPDGDLIYERTYENGLSLYTTPSGYIGSMMITEDYGQTLIPLATYNFIRDHEPAFRYGGDSSEVEALVSDVPYMQSYNDPAAYAGKVVRVEGAPFYGSSLWDDYPGGYALLSLTLTMPDNRAHAIWLHIFGTVEEMTALQAQFTDGQTVSFIGVPLQPVEDSDQDYIYQRYLCAKFY